MSDDQRRETKPDAQTGKQTAVQSRKGMETAVDPAERETAVDRQPIERKG